MSKAWPDKLAVSPCPESFDKAFLPAERTACSPLLRKLTISGMAGLIKGRNSAFNVMPVSKVRPDRLIGLPRSESVDRASAHAI